VTEEIELAAKSTGAVVGAVLEASGVTKPMQEVTGWLASWMHPRLVASAAKQMMVAVEKLELAGIKPGAVRDEQMRALLEEGAREEDDGLKEKWANLFANGLAGESDGAPRAYTEVLRQLEPAEVLMLDRMASGAIDVQGTESGARMWRGETKGTSGTVCVNLERLGLIRAWARARSSERRADRHWCGVVASDALDPVRRQLRRSVSRSGAARPTAAGPLAHLVLSGGAGSSPVRGIPKMPGNTRVLVWSDCRSAIWSPVGRNRPDDSTPH
jgi:hypothetical protein